MKASLLFPLFVLLALTISTAEAASGSDVSGPDGSACSQAAPALPRALLPDTQSFLLSAGPGQPCYRIWLYRPAGDIASRGVPHADEKGSAVLADRDAPPLLVLLDGNATFALAVSAARLQARLVGPLVIAAVAPAKDALFDERQRFRDYTSVAANSWGVPRGPDGHALKTGGAAAFEAFIEGPLLEAVAERGPVSSTQRTLFGHSLGGFLVLHDLLNRPRVFSQYFAASPSLWWNDRELLKRLPSLRAHGGAGPADEAPRSAVKLILRAGGDEQRIAPNATPARIERVTHAAMLDNLRSFNVTLRDMPEAGIDTQLSLYPGQNHISYLPAAISEAVTFAAGHGNVASE